MIYLYTYLFVALSISLLYLSVFYKSIQSKVQSNLETKTGGVKIEDVFELSKQKRAEKRALKQKEEKEASKFRKFIRAILKPIKAIFRFIVKILKPVVRALGTFFNFILLVALGMVLAPISLIELIKHWKGAEAK